MGDSARYTIAFSVLSFVMSSVFQLILLPGLGADELIPGGGHMINVTHAKEVNSLLRGAMDSRR